MKNSFILFVIFILFYSCQPSSTISNYDNTLKEAIQNSTEVLSDSSIYVVKNTAIQYEDSLIHKGNFYTEFRNSSFEEDAVGHSLVPFLWTNCGNLKESPIDIHDYQSNIFQVKAEAIDGNNYIGMVTRDMGTKESIGQYLDATLYAGQTYSFSLFACRSQKYISLSRKTLKEANFNKPAILKIHGGNDCDNINLLASTKAIVHTNWVEYIFVFDVEENVYFLLIEADYENLEVKPYNGNILIDNISPIYKINKS